MNTGSVAAFIDLSPLGMAESADRLALLERPDVLGRIVSRAIVHCARPLADLPSGWSHAGSVPAEQAASWAFEVASDHDLSLLIVAAGATPACESISALLEALTIDPLFGIAIPRFANAAGRLCTLDAFGPGVLSAPLRVLTALPDIQILLERVAPCMLIRRELIGNLSFAAETGLWPSLADYVLRARRAGFRPVVCNRVVVTQDTFGDGSWGCQEHDIQRLRQRYAEPVRSSACDRTKRERLLAAVFDRPHTLVLDARNLPPMFNGTSAAILGACDALYRAQPDDSVTLLIHPEAVACHQAATRFPKWAICNGAPSHAHAAALRLSQPWHAADLDSLSEIAAVNVYWMLDNIGWDIAYEAAADLDDTWQRLAGEADCLLFISDFSRQRFANRFSCHPDVLLKPCRLSLDPAHYAVPIADEGPTPPYWLIIGNRYEHKNVPATVDLLARSFPSQDLVVFGDREQPRAVRVTRFASGQVDAAMIGACYARADVVVFPSFYEGFGLPIIEGLTYGRTVVARDSLLMRELAKEYRGPGRLIGYSSERELVNVLSSIRRGEHPAEIALNTRADHETWGWNAVAACMLATIRGLVDAAPSKQMLRRTGLSRGLRWPDSSTGRCFGTLIDKPISAEMTSCPDDGRDDV